MISRELMHQAVQRLQVILSNINLAEVEQDHDERRLRFENAKQAIRELTDLLNAQVEPLE